MIEIQVFRAFYELVMWDFVLQATELSCNLVLVYLLFIRQLSKAWFRMENFSLISGEKGVGTAYSYSCLFRPHFPQIKICLVLCAVRF